MVGNGHDEAEVLPCECGALEGQLHEEGCRWELCPFCGATEAGGCECIYDHLGLRRRVHSPEHEYLADEVYSNGPSASQEAAWRARCAERGRLPYVYAPQSCARCGGLWPDLFVVQDRAWEYYAGPALRTSIICEACFRTLRTNIDAHQARPPWVPPPDEIDAYIVAWRTGDRDTLKKLDPEKFAPGPSRSIRFP